MTQQPIMRTYSGATSAEVEEAYRADATQAARAGYVPISYAWEQNGHGLQLKVGYQLGAEGAPAAPAEAAERQGMDEESAAVMADAGDAAVDVEADRSPALERDVEPYSPAADVYSPTTEPYAPPGDQWFGSPPEGHAAETDEQAVQAAQVEAETPASAEVAAPAEAAATAEAAAPAETPSPAPAAAAATTPVGRSALMTVTTVELHCAGEPLRLIRTGFPEIPHMPVVDRWRWAREHLDDARRAVIDEPRGHRDMYAAVLTPAFSDQADIGVLFMHNEGWSTMCGHGIIAITTGLIEEGLHLATTPLTTIRFETPAGIVAANAATVSTEKGEIAVQGVRFTNVPAFVAERAIALRPDGVELHGNAAEQGWLSVDLAFGGAFYGIVDAADLGLRVVPDQADTLRRAGAAITELLRRGHTPVHPTDSSLGFVYGTILVDHQPQTSPDGRAGEANVRNATIFADAELDRSPCGSGTSALLAQWHADGRLQVGQQVINAGITGDYLLGRIESAGRFGPYAAVTTSVQGTAFVTGYSTLVVDARDPLGAGFRLS